ncbi:MAG: hypothetical protein K0Q73_3129, partial [Paenibacillus sp.]|nr:hypothetical protein [Paenibacillus sp.]
MFFIRLKVELKTYFLLDNVIYL